MTCVLVRSMFAMVLRFIHYLLAGSRNMDFVQELRMCRALLDLGKLFHYGRKKIMHIF